MFAEEYRRTSDNNAHIAVTVFRDAGKLFPLPYASAPRIRNNSAVLGAIGINLSPYVVSHGILKSQPVRESKPVIAANALAVLITASYAGDCCAVL